MYCIVIGVLTTPWAYQFSACPVAIKLNKNSLAVKKVQGQSEATNISDQKL